MRKLLGLVLALAMLVMAVPAYAEADVSLANWAGHWNNFAGYLENEGVQEAYAKKAETDAEGKTAEEIKDNYINGETYKCDIAAMVIEGDEISFYDAALTEDAEPTAKATYAFSGMVKDANDREFAHFEAQGDAPHKAFLLLPAEADVPGETMMHFHFRYGDDAESLLTMDGWYATMIAADSTDALIVGHMTH